MDREEITVKFRTITPIWTGDAWGENSELKPSAIIGSLRFWFEIYCHFAGIEVKEKEELNYNEFKKELEKALKDNPNQDIDKLSFEIASKMLTLPSLIFGCTGWKSRVEIESIEYLGDYCFGNRLKLPYAFSIKKDKSQKINEYKTEEEFKEEVNKYSGKKFKEKFDKFKNDYSIFFFPQPYFYGEFKITFNTTNEIKEKVLLPLLKYIQKYGFIGSKNNLGYGRVKIEIVEQNLEACEFDFSEFGEDKKITEDIFKEVNEEVFEENKKLILINFINNNDQKLSELIENLLKKKAKMRQNLIDQENRHYTFGTVKKAKWEKIDVPQATKIIPLISKNIDNSYCGKFLSIVGIRNFGVKNEQ